MKEDKVRENRLRRAASRQRLRLSRSRRRDPLACDYGLYRLSREDGTIVAEADGVPLDDIEHYLTTPR